MKKMNLVKASVLAAGLTPALGLAELTGNVGATNNYVWRGVTQAADGPAISGGVDYEHGSGFYAGTWISNVNFSAATGSQQYEQDYYAGFAGGSGDLSYDVGYIYWDYPLAPGADFGEAYGSVGYDILSVQVNYTTNSQTDPDTESAFVEGDIYAQATLDFPLTDDGLGMSLTAGHYEYNDDGLDADNDGVASVSSYNHYNAYLNKGEFSFGVEGNDMDGGRADNQRFVVSWSKSFDLM